MVQGPEAGWTLTPFEEAEEAGGVAVDSATVHPVAQVPTTVASRGGDWYCLGNSELGISCSADV